MTRRSSLFAVLLAVGPSFTMEARPPGEDEEREGRPGETAEYFESRFEWYLETWGEDGKIDPERQLARVRTEYEQYRKDRRAGRVVEVAPEGPVQPGVFRFIGPFTAAGRATTIELHPTDPNIAYAGAAGGGVWKTVDQGANWRPLTDGLGNLSTGGIAIAPSNPSILYFGTGEGGYATGFIPGIGVFKSTDAGETWRVPSSIVSELVYRMLVDRTNPELVLAFTRDGVQRSVNGGLDWTRTSDPTWGDATDVAQVLNSPNVLHATFANQTSNGRYAKSSDFGQTWTQKSSGLAAQGTYGRTSVGVSANGLRVYLLSSGLAPEFTQVGFYRSADGGETFGRQFTSTPNILRRQGWYDNVIAVDPDNADLVFAGGVGVFRSTNGGVTFVGTAGNVHVDQHHFVFRRVGSQKVLWFANDGGIYLSTNGGTSFQDRNRGLGTRQYYGIAIDPARPDVVFAGAQDNGVTRMGDASAEDSGISDIPADGFEVAVDPDAPQRVFATAQYSSLFRSGRDGDKGSFSYVSTPFAGGWYESGEGDIPKPFLSWVTLDPNNPRTVYMGTWRIWRSDDQGDNWTSLPADAFNPATTTRALAVAPGNSSRLLAIQADRLLVSNDRGATWLNVTGTGALPNVPTLKNVEIDPSNADNMWVSATGNAAVGRVFRSTNGGTNWTRADQGLPAFAVEVVRVDPFDSATVYAGTLVGLYRSSNSGATWERHGQGLPAVAVHDIQIARDASRIVLGTYGRGLWRADAPVSNHRPVVSISEPPASPTVLPGEPVAFSGTATDPDGDALSYRWDFGPEGVASGAAPGSISFRSPGRYRVGLVATDVHGAKGAAFVDVLVPAPNDGCEGAIPLALVPDVPAVFRTSSATAQTVDGSDPATCSQPAIAHSMWFSFTAPANGTVDIDTAGSGGDTIAALYQGPCTSLGTALDCNDEAVGGSSGYSKLNTIPVTSGTTYRLLVASWASGSFQPGIDNLITRVLFKPATPFSAGTTATLPVLLDAFGRGGARYVSDLALLNRSAAPLTLGLTYGGGASGTDRTTSLTLAPGEQLRAKDALGELRREGLFIPPALATASQVGSLTALVTNGDPNGLILASRTASPNTNAAVGGSFGLFSQGTSYADAADAGPVYVYGLRQTERDRANVAFMHVRTPGVTDAITLEVEIFTAAGASAGTQSVTLAPTEWKQLNEILSGAGAEPGTGGAKRAGAGATTSDGGYVRVRRTAGNGRFVVYGVVNDQKTADGSLVPMARAGELTAASSVLVPIVLEAGGLGGSYYTSELVLANRSTKSGTAVLRYVGAPLFGGAGTGTVRVPLAAGSQKVLDGVLAYLRTNGLSIPTAGAQGGALFVTFEGFDATDDVYAGVRTGTPNPDAAQGGTFGVFSAGVPSAALATSSAIVPGLRLDASARTNVAAVNAGDSPITLEIKLRSFEGYDAGQTLTRTLAPGEWYQWSNVFALAGAGAGEGYAIITRTAGTSSWFAYGVLNDSATSDGSVVSMVR